MNEPTPLPPADSPVPESAATSPASPAAPAVEAAAESAAPAAAAPAAESVAVAAVAEDDTATAAEQAANVAEPAAVPVAEAAPAVESVAADPAAASDSAAAPAADAAAAAAAAPAIAELSPAACAARLAELFAAVFGAGNAKPLKLRIQADIQQRAPGTFTKRALSVFLHRHTTGNPYLRAMATATQRFDLDGQPAGDLSQEHRDAAAAELARRKALYEERRKAERDAQRQAQREAFRAARGPVAAAPPQARPGEPADAAGVEPLAPVDGAPAAALGAQARPQHPERRPEHRPPRRDAGPRGHDRPRLAQAQAGSPGQPQGRPQEQRQDPRPQRRPERGAGASGSARPPYRDAAGPRPERLAAPQLADQAPGEGRPAAAPTQPRAVPSASPAAVYSPEDEARRGRAALARAFAASPLKKSSFCALKGMTEAALDTVLAQVRSESPPEPRPPAAAPGSGPANAPAGRDGGAWRDRPGPGQNRGRPPRGP